MHKKEFQFQAELQNVDYCHDGSFHALNIYEIIYNTFVKKNSVLIKLKYYLSTFMTKKLVLTFLHYKLQTVHIIIPLSFGIILLDTQKPAIFSSTNNLEQLYARSSD